MSIVIFLFQESNIADSSILKSRYLTWASSRWSFSLNWGWDIVFIELCKKEKRDLMIDPSLKAAKYLARLKWLVSNRPVSIDQRHFIRSSMNWITWWLVDFCTSAFRVNFHMNLITAVRICLNHMSMAYLNTPNAQFFRVEPPRITLLLTYSWQFDCASSS